MATAKMETAADRYRRRKREMEAADVLHDVECSTCKETWKCRRVGVAFWVSSGILPLHLVETMIAASKTGTNADDVLKTMATREILESIEFSSKVVRYTAVEPHIADTPTEPNDILPEEVMTCCYTTLLNWQMKGGEEAAGLQNFPAG